MRSLTRHTLQWIKEAKYLCPNAILFLVGTHADERTDMRDSFVQTKEARYAPLPISFLPCSVSPSSRSRFCVCYVSRTHYHSSFDSAAQGMQAALDLGARHYVECCCVDGDTAPRAFGDCIARMPAVETGLRACRVLVCSDGYSMPLWCSC
jgi:hypothetical protein